MLVIVEGGTSEPPLDLLLDSTALSRSEACDAPTSMMGFESLEEHTALERLHSSSVSSCCSRGALLNSLGVFTPSGSLVSSCRVERGLIRALKENLRGVVESASAASLVKEVEAHTYKALVKKHETVLLDFWAPCQ